MEKKFEHGPFCWHELVTPNADGVKSFYEGLFGWKRSTMPMNDGSAYLMFQRGAEQQAGVKPMGSAMKSGSSQWLDYVYVDDVDKAVENAVRLKGSVVQPAQEISGVGRFAVVRDPSGAQVALWHNHESK